MYHHQHNPSVPNMHIVGRPSCLVTTSTTESASPLLASSPSSHSGSKTTTDGDSGVKCTNCGCDKTTTWRRDPKGRLVCNPCGLYYRLYKVCQRVRVCVPGHHTYA